MKIFLENFKYEYELKVLLQSKCISEEEFLFFEIDKVDKNSDAYIILKKHDIKKELVQCEYRFKTFNKKIEDAIRPHEKTEKNSYKRLLYQFLNEYFSFTLDWGILTGIRPTKLFHEYDIRCENPEQRDYEFKNDLLISENKAKILTQIESVHQNLLQDIDQNNYSVYISVPFCPSKCDYCTFFSNDIKNKGKLTRPYIQALKKELEIVIHSQWTCERKLDSLYFGGGTPSSLNAKDLALLLEHTNQILDFSQIREITFEAGRPDTIDTEKLNILKNYGINRISINPQTMNDSTLEIIGRKHTSADIIRTFRDARMAGFNNINMDIILGLENETLDDIRHTLKVIFDLSPDSITMHSLTLKKASDLTKRIDRKTVEKQQQGIVDMITLVYEEMEKNEYLPYYLYRQKNTLGGQENVGFSKKGKESFYNIFIIEEYQNILSFGPGSVSRYVYPDENRVERISNTKNLEEYIQNLDKYIKKKMEMQV